MAAPKFTPVQRAANLLTVSDWYLRGKTQAAIGEHLGCSQAQVSAYLKKLYKLWEANALVNIDRRKAIELSRIDKVEAEAWSAWERSQQDAETETTTTGAQSTTTVKREGQTGDPRFLDVIQRCITQRCKIIGIEAPTKSEIRVTDVDIDAAIAAELARLAAAGQAEAAGTAESSAPADAGTDPA